MALIAPTPAKNGTLLTPKAPNLPIAPVEYTQQYQDQLNNALRLYFNQIDNFSQGTNRPDSGTTTQRPIDNLFIGQTYFDTTLNQLILWNGSAWVPVATITGTVTSVGLSAPSIFSVSGSPVTTSGTLALSYSGTPLPVANGGTGNTTGQAASVANTLTAGTGLTSTSTYNGSVATTFNATGTTINSQTTGYTLIASDAGKTISITTGGVTIPNAIMAAGNIVSIYNNSGSSQTITQGAGVTLQWAGQTTSTTGNRTLGLYGIATVIYISASNAVISGAGLT